MWHLFLLLSLNDLERKRVPHLQGSRIRLHLGIRSLNQQCDEDLLCVRHCSRHLG